MTKNPTDLEVLNAIYDRQYSNFLAYSNEKKTRSSKIYVPIDIKMIAKSLDTDVDIVFGRLYYHLNEKYGYKNEDGSRVEFFALKIGEDIHCVNFPYLASVLADLRDQNKKYFAATIIAAFSLVVAIISIFIAILS